jgi:hypothetical protein
MACTEVNQSTGEVKKFIFCVRCGCLIEIGVPHLCRSLELTTGGAFR